MGPAACALPSLSERAIFRPGGAIAGGGRELTCVLARPTAGGVGWRQCDCPSENPLGIVRLCLADALTHGQFTGPGRGAGCLES